jgi:hypothetical protein
MAENNHHSYVLAAVVVVGAVFLLSFFGNTDITGHAVFPRQTVYGSEPAFIPQEGKVGDAPLGCKYEDAYLYVQQNPGSTGNAFCKSLGYKYAAYTEKTSSRILLDGADGDCYNGNIQVDEIRYSWKVPGSESLQRQSVVCATVPTAPVGTSWGRAEPEAGDVLNFATVEGALCCQ